MSARFRSEIRTVMLLAAACVALVAVIYGEVQRRPSALIDTFDANGHLTVVAELPADPTFTMPKADQFAAALERPMFSPTRRTLTRPGSAMPPLTSADFSLIGVVISPNERVVLVKPHNEDAIKRLHEGDVLGGWVAVSIASDRVIFRQGATEQEIMLDYDVPAPASPVSGLEAETGSEPSYSEDSGDRPANGESGSDQSGVEVPEATGAFDP